jgi:hypothetical protein
MRQGNMHIKYKLKILQAVIIGLLLIGTLITPTSISQKINSINNNSPIIKNENLIDLGVVHTYGDPTETGTIDISRSDGSIVEYTYVADPTCVKFEEPEVPLGEDDTVGLTDTFIITFYGGGLPITV